MFDAGGARALLKGLEKLFRQLQVRLHPALAGGVGEVQVQPQELLRVLRLLQCRQGGSRVNLLPLNTWAKTKTVKQAKQIGVLMAVIDAVIHGGSQRKGL